MANEKNWHYKHNVDTDGADTEETGKNWMHTFFTFLSGGADSRAGSDLAAWEIISSSNGSATAGNGGNWSSPSDVVFNNAGSAHSWFVARKNILPISTANPDGYIWLTVDCENLDNAYGWFGFQREEPDYSANTVNNRPVETATTYARDIHYRYVYDAGQTSFFNGIMDETGSFVIWSSRNYPGLFNYPFSLACIRLETPRSGEVDPYPLFMKASYSTSQTNPPHGPWDTTSNYYTTFSQGHTSYSYAKWASYGAQAMWLEDGSREATTGNYTCGLTYQCPGNAANGPQFDMDSEGSDIDGTYPRLPVFICNLYDSSATRVRGRLPDITTSVQGNLSGLVSPQTGSITACMMGDLFFPATASMLPGI